MIFGSGNFRWPDIIFDARIEILTLINLLLDIHDGILGDDLYIWTWPASRWPNIIFYARIEILTITNLPLDIHDGILGVTSISVPGWPPGSASSGLQVNERWALDCLTNVEYYFKIFSPRKKIIHMKLDIFCVFT